MLDSMAVLSDGDRSITAISYVNFLLQVLPYAHVPPAMSLQQLSPVLCHSLLQLWLVLWYTTVL